ncbi:Small membrane protein related [Aphelenchoides besseyi]|nr:Small membrane protein related [Aphelenchoides besseyi]
MAAFLGDLQNRFHDIDWSIRRNQLASIGSGILFSLGIWLYIDTAASTGKADWNNVYVLVTIASCIAMFMVNAVSNVHLQESYASEPNPGARLWMMFAFILSFSSLVAALWLMFSDYVLRQGNDPKWPGVSLFLNNFLIFCASLVYKFGRTEENF